MTMVKAVQALCAVDAVVSSFLRTVAAPI
jgi:hypothetical protein